MEEIYEKSFRGGCVRGHGGKPWRCHSRRWMRPWLPCHAIRRMYRRWLGHRGSVRVERVPCRGSASSLVRIRLCLAPALPCLLRIELRVKSPLDRFLTPSCRRSVDGRPATACHASSPRLSLWRGAKSIFALLQLSALL